MSKNSSSDVNFLKLFKRYFGLRSRQECLTTQILVLNIYDIRN